MAINATGILAAVESHALASGYFERVNRHEPKNAPGAGISASIWVQSLSAFARTSGLAVTSALLVLNVRIQQNMLTEPQDDIDPEIIAAVDDLFASYAGDFTLGGVVDAVDLQGMSGTPLQALAGYLNHDGKLYRVMTIVLPLIINDAWTQEA